MVRKHCFSARDAGKDAFSASRKTREEMRLDKSLRDEQIAVESGGIDDAFSARRKSADIPEMRLVSAIVYDYFFIFDYRFAELVDKLVLCRSSVASGRDKDRDLRVRRRKADPFQHFGYDKLARNRPCMVTCDNYYISFSFS